MEVGFVYQAHTINDTSLVLEKLDTEPKNLLVGLALILLVRDNGEPDFYIFANLEDPKPEDKVRIAAVLRTHGIPTDLSYKSLLENPHFGGSFSGTLEQIRAGFTLAMARFHPDLFSE